MAKRAATPPKAKQPPGEREKARIESAVAACRARRQPVWAEAKPNGESGTLHSPHADESGFAFRLMDAFGTASHDFVSVQLNALTRIGGPGQAADQAVRLNAALAFVEAVRPANELEGALAAQMAAVHALTLYCAGQVRNADMLNQAESFGSLTVKLSRTFAAQVEALARLRGGGKQQIEVQHVHVNGNAVVGNVTTGGGGETQNGTQPLAPALAYASGETVPCPLEADGKALSVAGGEGQGAMPHARRR